MVAVTSYIRSILPINDCIATLLPIFLLYYVLPLILCGLILLFHKWKKIFTENQVRVYFLSITVGVYSISSLNSAVDQLFLPYILASTVTIAVATIITFFWKISLHTVGIGGLLAVVIVWTRMMPQVVLPLIPIVVICAGLVGFARLQLQAHTQSQIYVGYLVGFFATLGGILLLSM